MALVDLITEDVVKVPLVSDNKNDIIKELIEILIDAGKINDADAAYHAIIRREEQGSTGLEKGVAVPHAKCEEVSNLTVAIGIKPSGVDFDAIDGKPSYLFFMLLAPPDQSGPHIEALAEIARMTRSEAFCSTLINAKSEKEVVELFKEE